MSTINQLAGKNKQLRPRATVSSDAAIKGITTLAAIRDKETTSQDGGDNDKVDTESKQKRQFFFADPKSDNGGMRIIEISSALSSEKGSVRESDVSDQQDDFDDCEDGLLADWNNNRSWQTRQTTPEK